MSAAQTPVSHAVPDAPHGTLRGARMGCGCMWCRSAKRAVRVTVTTTGTSGAGIR
ncbi:MAG: hypothetical protein ACRDTH_05000 [Pseudonocardiaceae bacterium]